MSDEAKDLDGWTTVVRSGGRNRVQPSSRAVSQGNSEAGPSSTCKGSRSVARSRISTEARDPKRSASRLARAHPIAADPAEAAAVTTGLAALSLPASSAADTELAEGSTAVPSTSKHNQGPQPQLRDTPVVAPSPARPSLLPRSQPFANKKEWPFKLGEPIPTDYLSYRYRPQSAKSRCVLQSCRRSIGQDYSVSWISFESGNPRGKLGSLHVQCVQQLLEALGRCTDIIEFNLNPDFEKVVNRIMRDPSACEWRGPSPWDSRPPSEPDDLYWHQCATCKEVLQRDQGTMRTAVPDDPCGRWLFVHTGCMSGPVALDITDVVSRRKKGGHGFQ